MIGEPRDAGDVGERQRQPELAGATPGSGHAGNRGRLLLPVPAAISHIRAVDYSEQRRGGRTHRGRGLLQRAQFLSHHALHQLGHQSHPVQRHVVQISVGLPESPRLFVAPQTAAAPPEPSEYVQHDDDNVCHDGHFQLGCSRSRSHRCSRRRRQRQCRALRDESQQQTAVAQVRPSEQSQQHSGHGQKRHSGTPRGARRQRQTSPSLRRRSPGHTKGQSGLK